MNINSSDFIKIIELLSQKTPFKCQYLTSRNMTGGCINDCYELVTTEGSFFLKANNAEKFPGMFDAEAQGLKILSEADCIHIPKVVFLGNIDNKSFLLIEFIRQTKEKEDFWDIFATQLATLHRKTNNLFGLETDNYIGSLPQKNKQMENWNEFFVLNRLIALVEIAYNKRMLDRSIVRQFENLYTKLDKIIPVEKPSLLHGDLWSGNFIVDEKGFPCLIDPAVYYGHREAEIAFTTLFGGFPQRFYQAYNENFPMEKQWEQRVDVFNLYPLLVHLILFGESYLMQIKRILKRFV